MANLPFLCLRNCKPKSTEDAQPFDRLAPARSFDTNEPVSTDASGPEPTVSIGLEYMRKLPAVKCDDVSNRSYLYDRGYDISGFISDNIDIYSYHFGEHKRDSVVSIFFNREKKVASVRENNLHLETPHKYKLPLYTIYEAVRYILSVGYHAIDWLVMDIEDMETLKIVKKYQRKHNLESEAEIRLTPESPDWDSFTETYHYKQADEILPGEPSKIVINRKERMIEGTNFPTAAVYVIMFSHSYAAKEKGDSPADSLKLEQDRLDSAIKAVDHVEAAKLRLTLGLVPGVKTFVDLLNEASEKSFLESLWGPTPYDTSEVVPETVPETASDGIDWESIWKLPSDIAPNSESETTSEVVPETVPEAVPETESENKSDDLSWEALLELSLKSTSKTEP
ncbi:hypothetical protein Cpir12675_006323 [Ceratocystis pirilliformis]|uniref:Uncharacterized protein n=1 Tax=Ceratocystis pirilliformis TaxID=259994 RepID=A0ABR3YI99_9PEZI